MFTLTKREPYWLTLFAAGALGDGEPAVEVKVKPADRAMRREAARAARPWMDGVDLSNEELAREDVDKLLDAGDATSRELMRLAIVEWRGIGDAEGNAVEATAENVEMALDDERFFDAMDRLYVTPATELDREKKGSAGSLNGTGAAATPAKGTARSPASKRASGAAKGASTRPTP